MKNKTGTIVVFVGVVLVFLGLLLPFMAISGDVLDKVSAAGMDPATLGSTSTNLFTPLCIVWLVAAAAALVFALIGNKAITLIASLIAGAGTLLSFFVNSNSDEVSMANSLGSLLGISGDVMTKGIGYWLALIGGIVMILAGAVYFVTTKKDPTEA